MTQEMAKALIEWEQARTAVLEAPVADVRKDGTFLDKLNALASAENELFILIRKSYQ